LQSEHSSHDSSRVALPLHVLFVLRKCVAHESPGLSMHLVHPHTMRFVVSFQCETAWCPAAQLGHFLHDVSNDRPSHGLACSYPDSQGTQSVHVKLSFHTPLPVHLRTSDAYLPLGHASQRSQSDEPSLLRIPVPSHGLSST
jgi:hypothetical protein